MKKKIYLVITILSIVTCFVFNITYFLVNNSSSKNFEKNLSSIIYPKREYPPLDLNYLNLWNKLSEESITNQNEYNDILIEFYKQSYVDLFYKYNPNPYENPIVSIPDKDIEQIVLNVTKSEDLQFFIAYYLRTLYIESRINYLTQPDLPLISTDKNVVIWALKEFSAITYFQWVKIWIHELGSTVEKDFNIDFYTFGSYSQFDQNGNRDWTKEHVLRKTMTCDLVETNLGELEDKKPETILKVAKQKNPNLNTNEIEILNEGNNYFAKVKDYNNYYYTSTGNKIQFSFDSEETEQPNQGSCQQAKEPIPMAKVNKILEPFIDEVYNFIYFQTI